MPRLRITSEPGAGRVIEVDSEVSLGRTNADVTIDDAEISRRHAVIRVVPGALEVEDLGSANGTFVNDSRIEGPARVANGQLVRIGTTVLVAEEIAPVAAPAQATRISSSADLEDLGVTVPRPGVPLAGNGASSAPLDALDTTRAHSTQPPPSLDATRARPIVEPDPGLGATRARPVVTNGSLDATQARPVVNQPQDATRARDVVKPAAEPSSASVLAPPRAQPPASPSGPAGTAPFHLPSHRRRTSLATRSWVPPTVSYGTVLLAAIALVIYFHSR